MKRLHCLLIFVFFCVECAVSQPFGSGTPVSLRKAMPILNDIQQLPSRQQLAKSNRFETYANSDVFAVPIETNLNICNSGQWNTIGDRNVWRLAISSVNAYSLNITFSDFYIPKDAEMYIYNADTTNVLGAFTSENNADILPTVPVCGDIVIVEYSEPVDAEFQGFFNIVQVAHDFKGIFASSSLSHCRKGDVSASSGHFPAVRRFLPAAAQ